MASTEPVVSTQISGEHGLVRFYIITYYGLWGHSLLRNLYFSVEALQRTPPKERGNPVQVRTSYVSTRHAESLEG